MRRLPKMVSPNEDCNIVRLFGTAFFRQATLHPCKVKIAVSVYPCIVALIADVRPCPPFAGIFFLGRPCARRSRQNAPCAAVSPVCGSRCSGSAFGLDTTSEKRIETRENKNSNGQKRGFRQAKTGIYTAMKESRNKARRLTPPKSQRPATADRDFGRK